MPLETAEPIIDLPARSITSKARTEASADVSPNHIVESETDAHPIEPTDQITAEVTEVDNLVQPEPQPLKNRVIQPDLVPIIESSPIAAETLEAPEEMIHSIERAEATAQPETAVEPAELSVTRPGVVVERAETVQPSVTSEPEVADAFGQDVENEIIPLKPELPEEFVYAAELVVEGLFEPEPVEQIDSPSAETEPEFIERLAEIVHFLGPEQAEAVEIILESISVIIAEIELLPELEPEMIQEFEQKLEEQFIALCEALKIEPDEELVRYFVRAIINRQPLPAIKAEQLTPEELKRRGSLEYLLADGLPSLKQLAGYASEFLATHLQLGRFALHTAQYQ